MEDSRREMMSVRLFLCQWSSTGTVTTSDCATDTDRPRQMDGCKTNSPGVELLLHC